MLVLLKCSKVYNNESVADTVHVLSECPETTKPYLCQIVGRVIEAIVTFLLMDNETMFISM